MSDTANELRRIAVVLDTIARTGVRVGPRRFLTQDASILRGIANGFDGAEDNPPSAAHD